jgi:hypothetical protein
MRVDNEPKGPRLTVGATSTLRMTRFKYNPCILSAQRPCCKGR